MLSQDSGYVLATSAVRVAVRRRGFVLIPVLGTSMDIPDRDELWSQLAYNPAGGSKGGQEEKS
jgi:hypothetical protein